MTRACPPYLRGAGPGSPAAIAAGAAALVAVLASIGAAPARAHVGSPDAVQEGLAGPYRLLVTIRPPDVVPGVARIDVRALDDDVARVSVVPLPVRGPGADSPPIADEARASADDSRLFRGRLWLMRAGEWQVRVTADGARGPGVLAVPVPALARVVRTMSPWLIALLFGLLGLLVTGAIAIVGASLREADLAAGAAPDRRRVARGRAGMLVTAALLALAIAGGRSWWNGEARLARRRLFQPMGVVATRTSPSTLSLALGNPEGMAARAADDLVPDHGHPMHLFLVRAPGLDAIAHLHPRSDGGGRFTQAVPPLPDGSYRLFGDIVHRTGIDETVTTTLALVGTPAGSAAPALAPAGALGAGFDPDDAVAIVPRAASDGAPEFPFPDGSGRLRWIEPRAPRAGETVALELEVETPEGHPVAGIEPYMGMAGHAMIVARDFSVFAHIHPTGSVPMAALAMLGGGGASGASSGSMDHSHHAIRLPPRVRFPCVFPRAGGYRLFVQIKLDGRIETAAFDLTVAAS